MAEQPEAADQREQREDGETNSWKRLLQLSCRLQPCGRRLRVMTEVHDTAGESTHSPLLTVPCHGSDPSLGSPTEAPVLRELPCRVDFSWRGLLAGRQWRERVKEAWTGDLALVFTPPANLLCSPAVLTLGYLCGYLRWVPAKKGVNGLEPRTSAVRTCCTLPLSYTPDLCARCGVPACRAAQAALVADAGSVDVALCTPMHVLDDDRGDSDDRLFLMVLRRAPPPSPSPEERPCSLAIDLIQGCKKLGLFSLDDLSQAALRGLSQLPDALQVNCLGWVASLPQPPRHPGSVIENSVAHATTTHLRNPPQWLTLPPRRHLVPSNLACDLLDRATTMGLLADFHDRPGLEPLWDLEHVPQGHAVSPPAASDRFRGGRIQF